MEWKWKWLSHVWLFETPWAIQSMEFSRPEYWSEYLFPSPGDFPQPKDQIHASHIAGGFFTSWATRKAPWWSWVKEEKQPFLTSLSTYSWLQSPEKFILSRHNRGSLARSFIVLWRFVVFTYKSPGSFWRKFIPSATPCLRVHRPWRPPSFSWNREMSSDSQHSRNNAGMGSL